MIDLFIVVSFIIGYVVWDMSIIPFRIWFFFLFLVSVIVFRLVVLDFDLSLPVGDKFFQSCDKWNC